MDYNNLRDRALNIKSLKEQSYRTLCNSKSLLESKSLELKEVKENRLIQESSLKILREIIDTMAQSHINSIVDMVSFALQTIFHDRDYSVKLVIGESRTANTAELVLVDKTTGEEIESSIPDSVGGGISSVIGFVLNVFYIMYFKLNRIMFLDESLSAVSSEYLPNLMDFVKQLSVKRGFIFVMIVHDDRFMQYSDHTYLMDKGKLKEVSNEIIE